MIWFEGDHFLLVGSVPCSWILVHQQSWICYYNCLKLLLLRHYIQIHIHIC